MGSKIWCYRLVHPILLGLTWKRTKSSPAANSVAWCLQRLLRPSAIQKPWHKSCSPCSWSPLWPQQLWMCPFFCKTYQPFRHGHAIFFVTLINHQFLGRIPHSLNLRKLQGHLQVFISKVSKIVNGLLPVAEPFQGTQQQVPVNHVAAEAKRLSVTKPCFVKTAESKENDRNVYLAGPVVESRFFCNPFFFAFMWFLNSWLV